MKKKRRVVKVVIVIFAILALLVLLAGFFLPSLSKAQESARQASLLNKQRAASLDRIILFGETASMPEAPAWQAPAPGEELWVIAKAEGEPVADENTPGSGALMAKLPDAEAEVPVPLKHTDVKTHISGYIATVEVTQQFHNPYGSKIEAVYVFPLPQNAAVHDFVMTIGDRRIRGIIRERKEAEEIYEEAKRQGYVASLLTQERPNIFTQRVANIEPAKRIDVNIKYFHTLACADGWYEYVFPMVVGPRFNPPGSTEGVGAVARGKPGISGQKTEVQYLKPGERSGHDIALAVELDGGVAIEEISCTSHVVSIQRPSKARASVRLSPNDTIPNKDFVLRYKVVGKRIKSALLTHRDKNGGYFTLMLYPPEDLSDIKRKPVEMVFVLDCSGSMSGKPIALAKQAAARALKKLEPDDTFQIIRFSSDASALGPAPLPASAANVRRGLRYLKSLNGGGGTMMIEGIKAALDFPHTPGRPRLVTFMTDGYIGNEMEILSEMSKRLGNTRVFSFGVGSSVNRYLLENMARLGHGAVAYISLNGSTAEVVDQYYERIRHPAMTDIRVDWGGMRVTESYPARVPDLFVGRPIVLTGRFEGTGKTTIRVSGRAGGRTQGIVIPVDTSAEHVGIDKVWARMKIADLSRQGVVQPDVELPDLIKQVALEYNLMSAYTAFVAVDSMTRTQGDFGTTVAVPVPVPDGVRYETTIRE